MRVNTVRDLALAVRGRRKDLGLTQADLAQRARVSATWISYFEAGRPTAEIGLVLRLLEALDFRLEIHGDQPVVGDGVGGPWDLDDLLSEYRA